MSETLKMLAVRDTIFDTLFLPENLGNGFKATAFAIPLGQYAGHRVKQAEDTNMLMCGMLDAPCTFDVQGVGVWINGAVPGDRWWNGTLFFQVNINPILSGPISDFADASLPKTIRDRTGPLCRIENKKRVYLRPLLDVSAAHAEKRITEIRQQEYFGCRFEFANRPDRPLQLVVGISGIRYFPDLQW